MTPNSCIFCLHDESPLIIYNGLCNCHPYIHKECIDDWYKLNPGKCPICLISNQSTNIIIINNNYRQKNIILLACCVCCISMCCSPFVMIALIFSLTSTITHVHHNTTIN